MAGSTRAGLTGPTSICPPTALADLESKVRDQTVALVTRIIAPNPGPYTGPGTNTWIVDAGPVVIVIDPGPDDDGHLAALNQRLAGRTVGVVLVTHSHPDHLPLAARLAAPHHASVRWTPEMRAGDV